MTVAGQLLNKVKYKLIKFFYGFFFVFGLLSFIFLILSFTDIPYFAYYNLGVKHSALKVKPDLIVVLGGSGMPSPDGLIRMYYAAEAAKKFSTTKIVLAQPYCKGDSEKQLKLMANELCLKGIDSMRINYENKGINTRTQALNIARMFKHEKEKLGLLLITSPEHMYRSCKTFKNVGFLNVGGMPTFEKPIEEESLIGKEEDEQNVNLSFRYNMWSYMQYEILVLREYCAIAYYKIKGWM